MLESHRPFSPLVADISSNNHGFDADAYRAAGHILIAIKTTEGTSYVNPYHRSWCLHAGLCHIGVIHYHFARPDLGTSPEDEAEHFLRCALPLAGGRDYLVLDQERPTPAGWAHDPAWSRAFDKYVQRHSRFHTILYSGRYLLTSEKGEWLVGSRKRVWEADWSSAPDYAPTGYEVALRQFTDGVYGPEPHSLPGIGRCDISRMNHRMFQAVSAHAHR